MSREILLLVDALAREKNVTRDVVFDALEGALASAMKKRFKEDADIRVSVAVFSADSVMATSGGTPFAPEYVAPSGVFSWRVASRA